MSLPAPLDLALLEDLAWKWGCDCVRGLSTGRQTRRV